MFPQSLSKTNISLGRPSFMEKECNENEITDYFIDNGVILEDEEEYDVLNDETFGHSPGDENDSEFRSPWENYDTHNDETFGEEITYDWEAEHEKMVSGLEVKNKNKSVLKQSNISEITDEKFQHNIVKPETVNRNGFCKTDPNRSYLEHDDLGDAIQNGNRITKNKVASLQTLEADKFRNDAHNKDLNDVYRSIETSTNENCDRLLENDKWYKDESNSDFNDSIGPNLSAFAQDYSLFSSGTNLLQNAGIHIPSVPNTTSRGIDDEFEEKLEALKLQQQPQSSASSVYSLADLERQWINDAASKSVITADCFRAYNSAFYVNSSSSTNTPTHMSNPTLSQSKSPMESFMNSEGALLDPNAVGMQFPTWRNSSTPFARQTPLPPSSPMMNGERDPQSMYAKMNPVNRPPPPQFDPKSFPVRVMTDNGIIMCNETLFRNASNFGDMNARTMPSFMNNNVLSRTKPHPDLDQSVIVSSDTLARFPDSPMMVDNSNLPRIGINVFQPPPGLTMDPAKFRHFQNTAVLQTRPPQITSCLALQPIQVLNGITPAERQKQLMKFQKEERLSVVDEYAGMMTEREKYWLAGVQLLQINAMDPFKDDYYFTNYQSRRKGNRGKSQTNNNKKWQNEHTKDYSPLQFENSLGKVQVGSVVAPRKVIDTDIFESSPKHNGKLNDSISDDPMANTSHRKRRSIMLHIENLYGKIIALETLQVNSVKNKMDPATTRAEFESIVNSLKDEILNLKDDFKIVMSIKKGKRLVLKLLMFCDNPEMVWLQIFEILERIIRGDQEHCMLLSYLPYFRTWLTTIDLATMSRLSNYLKNNLNFHLRDKFSVSIMANMIEQAELIYFYTVPADQKDWMEFIMTLAENAHQSLENVQKPVVSVKPQTLRSHLLKCEKLENGYVSNLLKIFSNNMRRP